MASLQHESRQVVAGDAGRLPDDGVQRSPEPQTLLAEARQWLAGLPGEVRPSQAAERFPHVVNRLAGLWKAPRQLDRYFEELMVDQRGGRRGFPLGVLMEVSNLREYYQTSVYPLRSCVWDGQS